MAIPPDHRHREDPNGLINLSDLLKEAPPPTQLVAETKTDRRYYVGLIIVGVAALAALAILGSRLLEPPEVPTPQQAPQRPVLTEGQQLRACMRGDKEVCDALNRVLARRYAPAGRGAALASCNKGSRLACSNFAYYLYRAGETSKAAELSRRDCRRRSSLACADLCTYELARGDALAALRAAKRALEFDGGYHGGHRCHGLVLAYQGKSSASATALRNARDLAHVRMGSIATVPSSTGKDLAKALQELKRRHRSKAKHIDAVLRLRERWDRAEAPVP